MTKHPWATAYALENSMVVIQRFSFAPTHHQSQVMGESSEIALTYAKIFLRELSPKNDFLDTAARAEHGCEIGTMLRETTIYGYGAWLTMAFAAGPQGLES